MSITFKADISTINSYKIIRLPVSSSEYLPSRGMVMIKGTINGIYFEVPLEPDGKGSHWFEVDDKLSSQIGETIGKPLSLQIEPLSEWTEPVIPDDIMNPIMKEGLLDQWNSLTIKARWEWLRWIRSTSNASTRQKRINVAISKLQKGDRRPCCFNSSLCTITEVSKSGVLLD
ncbi:MAG: DUF1905 domain-containing protein [Clostridiales bacterium]|nr:DUF1905 domain-containing protein [Clostridiales bacterium]